MDETRDQDTTFETKTMKILSRDFPSLQMLNLHSKHSSYEISRQLLVAPRANVFEEKEHYLIYF